MEQPLVSDVSAAGDARGPGFNARASATVVAETRDVMFLNHKPHIAILGPSSNVTVELLWNRRQSTNLNLCQAPSASRYSWPPIGSAGTPRSRNLNFRNHASNG